MRKLVLIMSVLVAVCMLPLPAVWAEQGEAIDNALDMTEYEYAVEAEAFDDVVEDNAEDGISLECLLSDSESADEYAEGQDEALGVSLGELIDEEASGAALSDGIIDPASEAAELKTDPDASWENELECVTVELPPQLQTDALFTGYLKRMFYGDAGGIPMATTEKGDRLTARQRGVYDLIKSMVLEVAEGNRSDTVVNIPVSKLLDKTRITAPAEHMWDWCNQIQADMSAVIDAIYSDCVYEIYWMKSTQYFYPDTDTQYDEETGGFTVNIADTMPCYFYVGDEFAVDHVTVNTSLVKYARQALKNAKAIVRKYAGYSDYAKLYAYAMEICQLVDYNYDALEPDWDPNNYNPYRLLWVFDGDPATKVVCAGYTAAYQYLCEMTDFDSGVRSYAVSGLTEGSDAGHAWNIIRMDDGKNYVVDVTWMDKADGTQDSTNLASRINGKKPYCGRSDSWFLVGARSGSVAGGYNIDYMGEQNDSRSFRSYYDDVRTRFGNAILTLSNTSYAPTGFMRIAGKTYYFDAESRYVTGKRKIGDTYYEFGKNGALSGAWAEGWQTIDGKRYYFDANGLHREHTIVRDAAVPATCTRKGKTEGSHCSVCKAVIKKQEVVPAFGHVPVTDAGYDATCTREGRTDGTHCQLCGTVLQKQEIIAPKGHTPVREGGIAATCTSNGWTDYEYCAVCYEKLKDSEYIPPTGHSVVVDAGYPATCTAEGRTASSYCANCGEVFEAQSVIPATGHSPVTDAGIAPAYGVPGLTEGSHCAVCGAVLVAQQPIPALTYEPLVLSRVKNNGVITMAVGEQRLIVPDFATAAGWTVTSYRYPRKPIVSVDGSGLITAVAEGKAKVTVLTAQKKNASITIKVVDPYKPAAIAIAQGKTVTITMGQPLQLNAVLAPESARATLTWASNKPKVATVDGNGLVIPQGEGKAKITVRTQNKKKAAITVRVVDPNKPLGIAIAQGKAITLKVGQSVQLGVGLNPATAQSALTWKTNKAAIANVDGNGVVTALKKGKAKITVMTYNKKKATIAVNVVE